MSNFASGMFAELDQLNARFRASVSDLTISFVSAEGEQCTYHMELIAHENIYAAKLAISKAASSLGVEVTSIVAHTPTIK